MTAPVYKRALQDAVGRATRARQVLRDGDDELALLVLDDLIGEAEAVLGVRRCSYCSAVFAWPGELAEHVDRIHAEEIPL